MSVPLTLTVDEETEGFLRYVAGRRDIEVEEVVQRAIAVYRYVVEARAAGKKLIVESKRGLRQQEAEITL